MSGPAGQTDALGQPPARHLVVGTSGHIDHGKSTLVKALTGTDPDRLAEEKARGITLDLGFAHWTTPQGQEIAFVDVPGHEKLVHNMLAGAAGLDAVMLVIAADEGVMPQTLEHLHICHQLAIPQGLVVLTRTDLAGPELTQLSREEAQKALAGTFLEEAPILEVSAATGQGLEALRQALARLAPLRREKQLSLPFRLPIDRVFTLKGFGTVVTGTVVAGGFQPSDPLVVFPQGQPIRVRGLQVHGRPAQRIEAGQRAALNLAAIGKDELARGDQLAAPGSLLTGYLLNIRLTRLPATPHGPPPTPLAQRSRVRVHLGSAEVMARLVLLEEEPLLPGGQALAQLRLESPLAARHGDRLILRSFSPVYTLGGGWVIDPQPVKSRRVRGHLAASLKALAQGAPEEQCLAAVRLAATAGLSHAQGQLKTGLTAKNWEKAVAALKSREQLVDLNPGPGRLIHLEALEGLEGVVVRSLERFHAAQPERPGLSRAELAGKLSLVLDEAELGRLLARMAKKGRLAEKDHHFALPGHEQGFQQSDQAALEQILAVLEKHGLQPPRRTVLLQEAGLEPRAGAALLKAAARQGSLVQIKEDLFYGPSQLQAIQRRLEEHLRAHGQISVVEFRDLLAIGRAHALDLLEHFDGQKLTLRLENHRVLR